VLFHADSFVSITSNIPMYMVNYCFPIITYILWEEYHNWNTFQTGDALSMGYMDYCLITGSNSCDQVCNEH